MVKKLLVLLLFLIIFYPQKALAIEDPASLPNNKFGIHILFTNELTDAAKLVNSSGGDWGYVTIPIQVGDKDLIKWQKFMDEAKESHVIPIIRLATEGDYFNTKVWRKPDYKDVLDFANFLDSLDWPVKNRYIIVFNEVNRSDEWGGNASPSEYAQVLSYAITVFKSKNQDYFIISSGLDNASVNVAGMSFNGYTYLRQMNQEVPGIFNQIDGLGSHSYPNPGFSASPLKNSEMSIATFRFEKELAESLSAKKLPVFITETGWSKERLSSDVIGSYYETAFNNTWSDASVIAVTPFLLRAYAGPFVNFSFLNTDGTPNDEYKAFEKLSKIKGTPTIITKILGEKASTDNIDEIKSFKIAENNKNKMSRKDTIETIFKWLFKL